LQLEEFAWRIFPKWFGEISRADAGHMMPASSNELAVVA